MGFHSDFMESNLRFDELDQTISTHPLLDDYKLIKQLI
jgi:cell fate (sporulation/competence/biofilm development) regulator YmcA (YheA/YmcA/DUF963 family)